jgi:hypothetical protein
MDRLIDSFKVAENQAYSILYFFIFALVVTIILAVVGGISFMRSGITPTFILAKIPTLPNFGVNGIMYFFAGAVFITIIFVLYRSQYVMTSKTLNLNANQGKIPPSKTFWLPAKMENPLDPRNLRVTEDEWQPTVCDAITMGLEVVISNTRAPDSKSPYKLLVYRGSSDLQDFQPNSPGSMPIGAGGLNDGLPSEMSPGVFIDRFTNDIIVFIDTDPVDDIYKDINNSFRESIRINDLPLNVPFHLHLTLVGKVLEVFVNCRLAGTKLLHGKPRSVPNEWYGRTGFAAAQAIIQNLTLWDGRLHTYHLMNMCKNPIHIKKEAWDLVLSGTMPILSLSQCGDLALTSRTYTTGISIEHK